MKGWKKLFEGDRVDFWETPKGEDGKSEIVLVIGGTHQYLDIQVFSELTHGTGVVSNQLFKPKDGCYQ